MGVPYFLVKSVLAGIPIGLAFLDIVGYVARVEGASMQPALNPGHTDTDYVFLSRWSVRHLELHRGDVVSLVSPKHPERRILKRVLALEGDVISTIGYYKPYVTVPEGHFWIEGDNTGNSLDSNTFGPVALGLVTARATCIVWPPSRWQILPSFMPPKRQPIVRSEKAS
ncbi:mitochondrial inner membrane protease subunit 2 [Phlebotomus argentipes]|uniref:mitochondrial inner membrane protease subunit 2 n=1 Tax=Phlebotomus argentipes TaxID=94469 RepID=UPI002892DF49|nr:mitochondrial inner membrane protease subunit 2 [Phlebotomus argentipes]